MPDEFDNRPWSEIYRVAGEDWVDKEAAAQLLEDTKSSVMAQKQALYGDIPVNKAEQKVKASKEWEDHIKKIVAARQAANHAKIHLEYVRMAAWEENNKNANARAELRL